MTEPTDAEILDLWESFVGEPTEEIPLSDSDKLCFARAALRSWGQPSGAGEVVYQASYKDGFWQDCSRERYEYLKAPRISSSVDWTSRILYTAPQPTHAQAGTVPLTGEQWQRITDLTGGRILTQAVKDEIERVIGIKGKEAGNAE